MIWQAINVGDITSAGKIRGDLTDPVKLIYYAQVRF